MVQVDLAVHQERMVQVDLAVHQERMVQVEVRVVRVLQVVGLQVSHQQPIIMY